MSFTARLISTGEIVDATELKDPYSELRAGDVVCKLPDCVGPMYLRRSLTGRFRTHFAHKDPVIVLEKDVLAWVVEEHERGQAALTGK